MVKSGFFSPEVIFFRFLKKEKEIQKFKIFDDQNFQKSVNRARNAQIWVNFYQNGSFFNFRQKSETVIFFRLQRLGFVQKIRKFQCMVFNKNAKNLRFWAFLAILAQNGQFWTVFGPK